MKNNKMIKVISGATLVSTLCYTLPVMAYTKEETVYSKLDANGNSYETVVSSHIKNEDGLDTIRDVSDLLNIENTNGYETFEKDGTTVVWNANGKDIYYKGETTKQLPISCNITYTLNGEEISKDDIVGKSGKVKITLQYTNNEKHTVNVNGRNVEMYTPFLVIAGTMIDNETNKNITISSGKMIDDGSKTIVVGVAFPGMKESLGIKKKGFEVPEKIEIEMDTTDFKLDTIASFVTPKIIESEEDLENLNKLDEVYSKVSKLQSASEEILQGAKSLKEGTEEYSNKKQEFNLAMKQVSEGMTNANNSYTQINDGINTLDKSGKAIGDGAEKISDGATLVSENLNLIATKIGEAKLGSQKLEEGEEKISQGLSTISQGLTMDAKTLQELQSLIDANNAMSAQETDPTKSAIFKNNAQTLAKFQKQISELQSGIGSVQAGMKEIQVGNENLTNGLTQLEEGTTTLASKTEELKQGADTLYKGSLTLSNGTKKISQGSNQIKQGLNTLDTSTTKLTIADNQLTEATTTIKEGANSLYEGILKFNNEGIKPICNALGGDLKDVTKRINKLGELSLEYNNYTMLEEKEEGSVQFILLSDSIKKESKQKEDKQDAVLNSENEKEKKEEQ